MTRQAAATRPPRKAKGDTAWYRSIKGRRALGILLTFALLIPLGILFVVPFFVMLSTALKTKPQIFQFPPSLIPDPIVWENFPEGWRGYDFIDFTGCTWNSVKITVNNIVGNLVSCTLAAYAFARLKARGKNIFFGILLATMLLPNEAVLIPQYVLFRILGWNDTHLPLMVPPWFGWPFFIFLLRQFFLTIPEELVDAAKIDGAGHARILMQIFIPLSKPALATLAIFAFVGNWNNFFGPLLYLRTPEIQTLPVCLVQYQGAYGNTDWNLMMAVATITVIPVLLIFIFGQRYFVEGIATSGVKR